MIDFPDFMKSSKNRISDKEQNTEDIEGYFYNGAYEIVNASYIVSDEPPKRGKDMNDYLKITLGIRYPQEQERL